jgi:hypothetical protein
MHDNSVVGADNDVGKKLIPITFRASISNTLPDVFDITFCINWQELEKYPLLRTTAGQPKAWRGTKST